jgi:hypothetical protein
LSPIPLRARTRTATVRIAGRPDLLILTACTTQRMKWQIAGLTVGVWEPDEPTNVWQSSLNDGLMMHAPQTEIPDDMKRDEVLPLDLRGAIDAIDFQLRMIRETLERIEVAIGFDVH